MRRWPPSAPPARSYARGSWGSRGWSLHTARYCRTEARKVFDVPGLQRSCLRFQRAMAENCVVDRSADNAYRCGRLQSLDVFLIIEADDSKSLADAPHKEHCLVSADAVSARTSSE